MASDAVMSDLESSECNELESDAESSEIIHETAYPDGIYSYGIFLNLHCKADILSEEICDEELSECNQFDSYDNEGDVVSTLSDQDTTGTNNNIHAYI